MISVGYTSTSQDVNTNTQNKARNYKDPKSEYTEGYKKITKGQIKDILATPQLMRSDCYLVSTLKALAKSGFGKQMLKQSIKTSPDGDTFEVRFNKYDKDNIYSVNSGDKYEVATGRTRFNPTGSVETATSDVIQDRKDAKPLYLRLFGYSNPLEGNLASVYMESLTGKKPVSIGDEGVLPLSSKREKVTELLDKIGSMPMNHHSFVAGSKMINCHDGIGKMHYYVIKKVDSDKKEVHLVNPRYVDLSKKEALEEFNADLKNDNYKDIEISYMQHDVENIPKVIKLDYDKFMNNFRSIVGYFDDKLSKK